MARTVLLVGTRKGCFVLESDDDRRDWDVRGPFCEGLARVPRRSTTTIAGSIYAAAASEWHGSAVWRSADLGETWTHSSEGLALRRRRRAEDVEGLEPRGDERTAARRRRDAGDLREPRRRRDLVAPDRRSPAAGERGLERPGQPAARPPRHLGDHADPERRTRASGRSSRASACSRRPTTAPTWTPRNEGLRADWPREHDEVGFCVHKLVRSPVDGDRMYQQNHVGMHRSDDGGQTWTEITEGLPTEFGFAAAAHPHDRDTFYVDPARPRATGARCPTATRPSGARAMRARAGSGSTRACRRRTRTSACCARGWRSTTYDSPGLYFGTSTGQVFASIDEGESWSEIAELPAGDLVRRGCGDRLVAEVYLPVDAAAALPGPAAPASSSTRRPSTRRSRQLDERWPGLRDRLCEPGPAIRPHIHVYVDRERAALDTPLEPRSRVDVIAAISGG